MAFKSTRLGRVSSRAPSSISDASHNEHHLLNPPSPPTAPTAMGKRKAVTSSSDEEDDAPLHMPASSPDRPLQTGRRSGKKAKVCLLLSYPNASTNLILPSPRQNRMMKVRQSRSRRNQSRSQRPKRRPKRRPGPPNLLYVHLCMYARISWPLTYI